MLRPPVDRHFQGSQEDCDGSASQPPGPWDQPHENKGNYQDGGNDNELGGLDAEVERQQGQDQVVLSYQAEQGVGKSQSMDQAEEKGEKIDNRQPGWVFDP